MDAAALPGLLILVGAVMLAVLWQIARRPVERRFAFRDTVRRPGEAALVVAGSLLGTALIAGSFIVGDTLDASIKASAWTQLGPIDEIVEVPDPSAAADIEQRIAGIDDPRIDGVMSFVVAQAPIASDGSGRRLAEPQAQVIEADFDAAADFGGDPTITGIEGPTPGPGETVITEDLASTLQVAAGDTITTYLFGSEADLRVDRIVPQEGIAGFWTGFESRSPNAFVMPGTIERLTEGELPGGIVPPTTTIAVSNRGGVEEGGALTQQVIPLLEEALGGAGSSLRVEPLKQDLLDAAEVAGDQFGQLFLGIGSFAIVAGILLLVNIFVMLAEERKGQLGMLRAVGLRRADLVRVFVIEGIIYSLIASAFGAILGIGVGWAIVTLAAPIFGTGDFALDLTFDVNPASVIGGFCLGLLISMMTVTMTSVRISRINIIRAIRDLPEPTVKKARTRALVVGALIAALTIASFVSSWGDESAWAIGILGPPIALFSLLPLLNRVIGRKVAVMLASAASLVWGIFGNVITGGQFFDSGEIFAFVIQGVLLTFAAVVMLSQTAENFEGAIRRIAARNLSLRLSIAYPIARRFRTGLTLGMYSLVMFTMVFIAVLSSVFGGQVENATQQEAGGFDVLVTAAASNPPTAEQLEAVEGVEQIAPLRYGTPLFHPQGVDQPTAWFATGIGPEFVDIGPPELEDRLPEFDSDRDTYRELLSDPNTVIIDSFFLQFGGGPPVQVIEMGDTMPVLDPVTGESVDRKVIGRTNSGQSFSGVFMSGDSLQEVLGGRATPTRFYVKTDGSASPNDVAVALQGRFVTNGVEADSFRAIIEESSDANIQFFRLMQGYLALGLLVGIAGLGVIMVRAVRDRRHEVGVLRSLGFLPAAVRRAFLLESGFVALQGIAIGSILALITSAQLVNSGDFGEGIEFAIPWLQVTVLCISALVASLIATAWPAQQASRIAPAVALRIAE
jgi:putative ABC transport system permease protein